MNQKYIPGAVIIFFMLAYALLGFGADKKPIGIDASEPIRIELPEFAQKTGRVAEAYIFALQNQDKVMYLACYCGCAGMQHSEKLIQHKSLKDCYIKPDGSYEPHASECKLCNDITLEARGLLMKGYSLKEVRKIIDGKYSGRGAGTETIFPP